MYANIPKSKFSATKNPFIVLNHAKMKASIRTPIEAFSFENFNSFCLKNSPNEKTITLDN